MSAEALRSSTTRPAGRRSLRWFVVDVALFAAFVAVLDVPLTGIAVHEWLGIAMGVGVVVHLVQHTSWIVTTTRRLFGTCSFRNRLNYLMMLALHASFLAVIVSGLVISEAALPFLGITIDPAAFWLWLHLASVGWVLWLTALHLALHSSWVVSTLQRFVVSPVKRRLAPAPRPEVGS